MMTQLEAGKLIAAARQIDTYIPQPDDLSTMVWMQRFNREDIDYRDAYEATMSLTARPITVLTIIDAVKLATRRTPTQIAEDVRSARRRGLVSKGWQEDVALPEDVRTRLAELRAESQAIAIQYKELA